MAPDARTKKRKRSDSDATASDGKKLILEPSSIPSTQVGPVLGMYVRTCFTIFWACISRRMLLSIRRDNG